MRLSFILKSLGAAIFSIALCCGAEKADGWVNILPDASLKGWTRIPIPAVDGLKPTLQWRVDATQNILICDCTGGHEWLRYDQELGDYILRAEFRYTPKTQEPLKYNSGIGVRLSKYGELWVQAQLGYNGNFLFGVNFADGALARFHLGKEMKEDRLKPAGQWNTYEIRVQGGKVTLTSNGVVVSEVDGIGLRKGYIGLEAEGYEIAFRNVQLKILE